jgi:hypothetical protein
MNTTSAALSIGKLNNPFWVHVIAACESVSLFPDLSYRVERGDLSADVYHSHNGIGPAVVIVVRPLESHEQSTTEIVAHKDIN